MKKNPLISIIIPTFNSKNNLDKCLESIRKQTYKNVEVIVVDQQSIDGTVDVAKKYKARYAIVQKAKFYSPPSKSRNKGASIAKGNILYHLDSDMRLTKNILQEAVSILDKNKKVGALMVHEQDKTKGFFSKCKALERFCYRGNDEIDSARIVRKNIFMQVGGYDETISSGEDFTIQQKYKKVCDVAYCRNTITHDLTDLSFIKMIQKKYSYGKTAHKFFKKSKRTGLEIVKSEVLMYLKNYKLLINHPILTCGMIFMKVSELLSAYIGYITARNI